MKEKDLIFNLSEFPREPAAKLSLKHIFPGNVERTNKVSYV